MAEINKLPVGKVLDKLRRTDASKNRFTAVEEKIEAARDELHRLRSDRRRLGSQMPRPDKDK